MRRATRRRPAASTRTRAPRVVRLLVAVLRAVALLCALQLASAPQAVGELVGGRDIACSEGTCATPCPDEQDGRGCQPGCLICHADHASPAVLPATVASVPELFAWPTPLAWSPPPSSYPPTRFLPTLERPPRA